MRVIWQEIVELFVLAIPVACVARTIVFEEIFRETRDYCQNRSKACRTLLARKFFYLFTCEYCFSHWVTALFMWMTDYHLLLGDWRGRVIGFFGLVFVANAYLNLYSRLRIELTSEKVEIKAKEQQIAAVDAGLSAEHRIGAGALDGAPIGESAGPSAHGAEDRARVSVAPRTT